MTAAAGTGTRRAGGPAMAYEHQINEHERPLARALWERIFPEDTQAFLDANS